MRKKRKRRQSAGTDSSSLFGRLRLHPFALAAALLVMAAAAVISVLFTPAEGQVIRVIDGDTIVVFHSGRAEKVRLLGIDTPEVNHPERGEEPFGPEASAYTRSRLLGRKVILRVDPIAEDRDGYGRLLRFVELEDGTDFNAELVRQGYARAMRQYPCSRKDRLIVLEQEARRQQLGMWKYWR